MARVSLPERCFLRFSPLLRFVFSLVSFSWHSWWSLWFCRIFLYIFRHFIIHDIRTISQAFLWSILWLHFIIHFYGTISQALVWSIHTITSFYNTFLQDYITGHLEVNPCHTMATFFLFVLIFLRMCWSVYSGSFPRVLLWHPFFFFWK